MGAFEIKYFFQPLASLNVYGTETDVSDLVSLSGGSEIKQFADSEDFNVGVFAFADVDITVDNVDGIFNTPEDYRSIFAFKRGDTKVRIVLRETVVTRDTAGIVTDSTITDTTLFKGIINEDGTREDFEREAISFKVLSIESVLNLEKIEPDFIVDGTDAKSALFSILDTDRIRSLLTLNIDNFTFKVTYVIDTGSDFDNISVFQAAQDILLGANSTLVVDGSDNVIVKARAVDDTLPIIDLFGKNDIQGRENILQIFNYNDGAHRMINSFRSGLNEVNDGGHIEEFGLRQRELTLGFITNVTNRLAIINSYLTEFKVPKQELEVLVPVGIGKDASLFQPVRITYPLRLESEEDGFLPVTGDAVYADTDTPYPREFGSRFIDDEIKFKIIEKRFSLQDWSYVFKLRQTGETYGEGFF